MSIEHGILVLCILFGLMLIGISWAKLRNKQLIRCGISLTLAMGLLLVGGVFATFLVDYNTYQRLTREHPVASIKFHTLGERHFQVILTEANNKPVFLELHGDQWQLDVRFIKWKGAAAWSGLKPMYRLERLSGRYEDILLERSASRSVYSIKEKVSPSLWDFFIDYQALIPWFDAHYGSATYLPMSHGAEFNINITASGLVARPKNEQARKALQHWL